MAVDTSLFLLGLDTNPTPTPFASADFKNGGCTLNGSPAALSDLLIAPRLVVYPTPVLTPGVGWNNIGTGGPVQVGYSASPALLTLMDLTGVGCSMVLDIAIANPSGGLNSFLIQLGDYPNWAFGWSGFLTCAGAAVLNEGLQDFFSPDASLPLALPFDGKFGATFSPASLRAVANGGTAIEKTPPDHQSLWANPTFTDMIATVSALDARVLVRSIKWYPPQTAAGLKRITQ